MRRSFGSPKLRLPKAKHDYDIRWSGQSIGNIYATSKADAIRLFRESRKPSNAVKITAVKRNTSNPADPRLYRAALAADDRYQAALEKSYGHKAGDMRYSYSLPAKLKKLAQAKQKADEKWRASMRSNPTRRNPILDIYTALTTPSVLSAIEKQREKIERSMRPRKRNAGGYSFRKSKKRMKAAGLYDEMVLRRHSGGDNVKRVPKSFRKTAKSKSYLGRTNKGRRNSVPASEDFYQGFHGEPSKELVHVKTDLFYHGATGAIGDLRKLKVKSENGKWKVTIKFSKPYPILSASENRKQLFIDGGDQSINLKDFGIGTEHESEVLGKITDVYYFTTKKHLRPEDGGTAVYHHKFGKIKPTLIYDVPNQLLAFAGGGYTIPDEGIDQ